MNAIQPNLVIFRVPDVDGSKTFVQVPLEGRAVNYTEAQEFNVLDGDDYNLLGFSEVVLAVETDAKDGSYELARVEITQVDGTPAVLYTDPFELALVVAQMVDEWNALPD